MLAGSEWAKLGSAELVEIDMADTGANPSRGSAAAVGIGELMAMDAARDAIAETDDPRPGTWAY
jgi:hypothetical protein